jgi:hypothetical protein
MGRHTIRLITPHRWKTAFILDVWSFEGDCGNTLCLVVEKVTSSVRAFLPLGILYPAVVFLIYVVKFLN